MDSGNSGEVPMPIDPAIDLASLLAPLEGESPTGVELSISDPDGPLIRLKDAWDEARKLIKEQAECERNGGIDSQGQPWRTIPDPDWDAIIEQASEILRAHSKDFRVAGWLAEALLRRDGVTGLRAGLQLCRGLSEQYWDSLWPAPTEDDGHSVMMAPFAGLVSEAAVPAVRRIVVVEGAKSGEREIRRYSALDYDRAKELETISNPEETERRISAGHITLTEFRAIAAVTPRERHDVLLADIDASLESLDWLADHFREHCRDDQYGEPTAPGMSAFREALTSVRRLVAELRGEDETAGDDAAADGGGAASGPGGRESMSREGAFQAIERIAQYFEKTEPHSPVPYALRQVVRWGRTPFPQLLSELLDDEGTMERLRRLVGLPAPPREEDS